MSSMDFRLRLLIVYLTLVAVTGRNLRRKETAASKSDSDTPEVIIRNYISEDNLFHPSGDEEIDITDHRAVDSRSPPQNGLDIAMKANAGMDVEPLDISDSVKSDIRRAAPGGSRRNSPSRGLSMEKLEERLHNEVGLSNLTIRGQASRFLLEVYRQLEEGADLTTASGHSRLDMAILQADTIRSFPVKASNERPNRISLTFNLANISPSEVTKRAELRLRPAKKGVMLRTHRYRVRVKVLVNALEVKTFRYVLRPDQQTVDGFVILDLTSVISNIVELGFGDATLKVVVSSKKRQGKRDQRNKRDILGRNPFEINDDGFVESGDSMLVVFTKDKDFFSKLQDKDSENMFVQKHKQTQKSHVKFYQDMLHSQPISSVDDDNNGGRFRRASNGKRRSHRCSKRDFYIDFDAIGWGEWIIYPRRFNAHICSGRCTAIQDQQMNPSNHAILQNIARLHDKTIPRPCCSSTKLRPLSMLYFDSDEIVVRSHEDMVVEECGCR